MTLRLQRIEIVNFRKFRAPVVIDGFTAGLNIVIEPNEIGKSTLLEALRAAFFVRHGTRNQLAQSYAPHGDAVAPQVSVDFEANGAPWTITKRFLRSAAIEVTGPQGRAQDDEAEARLHALLGSVRDTSQRGDAASYGALGLLWVAQTEGLAVTAPGQIVRETVRSTLESEVGSIMSGAAYRQVRQRIDEHYGHYWTPSGQPRERQKDAADRLAKAEEAARAAAERLAGLERNFTDLEAARTRLKVVEREVADDTDSEARKALVASLEIARAAAQILQTRQAEHGALDARLRELNDLNERYAAAAQRRQSAQAAADAVRTERAALADTLASAKQQASDARDSLERARTVRQEARAAQAQGEERLLAARRRVGLAAARDRHTELAELERRRTESQAIVGILILPDALAALEASDRAVAEARALLGAGATRIELIGEPAGLTIDGEPLAPGERILTRQARISFGAATLVVTPPAGTASAQEEYSSAQACHQAALDELGVEDLAAARARNDAARDALNDVRMIDARIEAITPADETIGLASGPAALKLLVETTKDVPEAESDDAPDADALRQAAEAADTDLARAQGVQDSAIEELRRVEQEDGALAAAEAGAMSDLANASADVEALKGKPDIENLAESLARSREAVAEAAVKLEDAKRDATAHDAKAIERRIETIDARTKAAGETRTQLAMEIARLEATVETEGGKGLAEHEAMAREEAGAAQTALAQTTEEAETLKLLRATLDEAHEETSAKFVGPVSRRAKRYVERLLPDCDLSFSEDLALEAVTRSGVREECGDLSKGTQEQLAMLTRIAFADMLLEQGRPVSLILDDPLAYSDDARLDLMIEILCEAAERMQVILLTSRDRAFRHVPGTRLSLARAPA